MSFNWSPSCVLAELFSDGHPPFDLSQLLTYHNSSDLELYPKCLDDIEDPAVKVSESLIFMLHN